MLFWAAMKPTSFQESRQVAAHLGTREWLKGTRTLIFPEICISMLCFPLFFICATTLDLVLRIFGIIFYMEVVWNSPKTTLQNVYYVILQLGVLYAFSNCIALI
jgi:hypothetical protein